MSDIKSILHEIKEIQSIYNSVKRISGKRAENLREKALERSMDVFDSIIIYLPISNVDSD